MSPLAKAFEALGDARKTLERFTNGEIPLDQVLPEYIKLRDKNYLHTLLAEFKEAFGSEGEMIVGKAAPSSDLNGGYFEEKQARLAGFFVGLKYSHPLMVYIMRRALDKNDLDTCYDKYIKGVDALCEDIGESADGHYPSQEFVERVTANAITELKAMQELKNQNALNSGESNGGNGKSDTNPWEDDYMI